MRGCLGDDSPSIPVLSLSTGWPSPPPTLCLVFEKPPSCTDPVSSPLRPPPHPHATPRPMLARPALRVPALWAASHIHLLRPRPSSGGSNTNVKAGDHHDMGLAKVNTLLQGCRGLLQGHQVLGGFWLQLRVHLDWREMRPGSGQRPGRQPSSSNSPRRSVSSVDPPPPPLSLLRGREGRA